MESLVVVLCIKYINTKVSQIYLVESLVVVLCIKYNNTKVSQISLMESLVLLCIKSILATILLPFLSLICDIHPQLDSKSTLRKSTKFTYKKSWFLVYVSKYSTGFRVLPIKIYFIFIRSYSRRNILLTVVLILPNPTHF